MRHRIVESIVRLAVRGQPGQGMMEYALIIAFVALAVILALTVFGTKVVNMYIEIGNSVPS